MPHLAKAVVNGLMSDYAETIVFTYNVLCMLGSQACAGPETYMQNIQTMTVKAGLF
jgi:hypothetical protein